jgi:hypothetical protein
VASHPPAHVGENVIPTFPSFKRVELADRVAVEAHTSRFQPYSDFNFTSLWAWDLRGERLLSELNGNLVVRFTDYHTNDPFLSFLGRSAAADTARRLAAYSSSIGLRAELRLVPDISVSSIGGISAEEDRDHFDYLYSTTQHVSLAGPRFKRARNFVRRFSREHVGYVFRAMDLNDASIRALISGLWQTWEAARRASADAGIGQERHAIERLLESARSHPLGSTGIFHGDSLLAFSIDEVLPNKYCTCHFWKADTRHPGIYDYLFHLKARLLRDAGIEALNCEQDLGVAGIRKWKLSYRPVGFLKKYIVSVAHARASEVP